MVNKNLIALAAEVAALERALLESGGELPPDLEATFDLTTGNLRAKVDRYRSVIDAFEARAKYFADLKAQAKAAQETFETQVERLKGRLRHAMTSSGETELQGNDWRYVLAHGKEKLVIKDSLPPEYLIEKVTLEPDKESIRTALEMGFAVPGAELVESTSLRAYVNLAGRAREVKEIEK
jgi:hypothetical protein